MSLIDTVIEKTGHFYFERGARSKSFKELMQSLQKAGDEIIERIQYAEEKAENRDKLSHIIGIERWGQRRLKGFLGDPAPDEEYDSYRPERGTSLKDLITMFKETRQETIDLADQMDKHGVMSHETVAHNTFGEMSARGWLNYLQVHASLESKRIK